MADRQDPSQYAFTAGPADGTAALPNVDIVNDQLQPRAEGDYADGSEMLELTPSPFADEVPELFHEHPGRFYTQGPSKTRDIGRPRTVPNVSGLLIPGDGLLAGWNFHETTGSVDALVRLRDGNDASAPVIAFLPLVAGESTRDWFLPGALKFRQGLFVEIAAGSIEAVVYTVETEDVI